jgi:hypothetical protein
MYPGFDVRVDPTIVDDAKGRQRAIREFIDDTRGMSVNMVPIGRFQDTMTGDERWEDLSIFLAQKIDGRFRVCANRCAEFIRRNLHQVYEVDFSPKAGKDYYARAGRPGR